MDNSVRNNEGEILLNKGAVTMEVHTQLRKYLWNQQEEKGYNKPPFNPRNYNNKRDERNSRKPNTCFRCGLEDHFIANCAKPDTSYNKFHWNMEKPKICAYILNKIDKTL